MRILKILSGSFRTLSRFPLRSGLTILSAVLGVAGALVSVNYALGGRQKVINQLARLGTNVLNITPQASRSIAGRARTGAIVTTLKDADYAAIRREVPGLAKSSAVSSRTVLIKAGDLAKNNCTVIGIEPEYMEIKNWRLSSGAMFDGADVRRMARIALLGSAVARDLFGAESPLGARILINRIPFEVTGVLTERGQSLDAANEYDQVYVPISTAMRRLANVDYLSAIVLEVDRWDHMDLTAGEVHDLLAKRHANLSRLPEDFQVQSQKQLLDTRIAASDRLLFLVRWIAGSALAVSGLGVLSIAWIGVKERTREFGTRRAIGAFREDIFIQILWESAILSVVGCGLGLGIALIASRILAKAANQPEVFNSISAWVAGGTSVLLNLLFGLLPARTAARLDPISALRFE